MRPAASDPPRNCRRCPRLSAFVRQWRARQPDWHNAPVPTWVPPDGDAAVKLLIVGLAPGLRGANRTGRAFTGDASGEMLHAMLVKHGLARGTFRNSPDDGFELADTAITNAVRCVPPENRPSASEINTCREHYLKRTVRRFENLQTMVTLGRIAHEATIKALDRRLADHPFGHNVKTTIGGLQIISSYHCSRYNVNTGRLTEEMFDAVFAAVRR